MNEEKYAIFCMEGGLGKAIASTAMAEIIKNNHPDRKLIVVCPWPEVFLNNPFVHRIYRLGNHPYFYRDYILDKDTLVFKGEPYFTSDHIQKRRHIILSWCELFKLQYNGETSRLVYNAAEMQSLAQKFGSRPKPVVVLQTNGGLYQNQKPYCWTRDIPPVQAQQLVSALKDKYHIMHVSRPSSYKLEGVETLPELPKRELLGVLLASQKRILIDSCLQHAAAAFSLPSTVLWVGTSHITFGYQMHNNIYPVAAKNMDHMIDSFLFDYSFDGSEHEFPFESNNLFDLNAVLEGF
jgi:hypothetical protein